MFRTEPEGPPKDAYAARLARLRRKEREHFVQVESILAMSLEPDADYARCQQAYESLAMDMEDWQLPAAHYLGARMVQVMEAAYAREQIIACMKDLSSFLPLYNQAAEQSARLGPAVWSALWNARSGGQVTRRVHRLGIQILQPRSAGCDQSRMQAERGVVR